MGAVLLTLLISTILGMPTSITLALVGSLTGATIAIGAEIDVALVTRVIVLGLLAPLIAALGGFLLTFIRLRAPRRASPFQVLRVYRAVTFPALAIAYAASYGQKVLFATALVMHIGVAEAAEIYWLMGVASCIFMLGVASGLRSSGRFIRHGVAAVTPVGLVWTEISTALTVTGGASLGIPLSMTQSLIGAILGVGLSRSTKAVYWKGMRRVGIAWIWTLPFAGLAAFGGASIFALGAV